MIEGTIISYIYCLLVDYSVYRKLKQDDINFKVNKEVIKRLIISLIPVINMIYTLYLEVNFLTSEKEFVEKLDELGIIDGTASRFSKEISDGNGTLNRELLDDIINDLNSENQKEDVNNYSTVAIIPSLKLERLRKHHKN